MQQSGAYSHRLPNNAMTLTSASGTAHDERFERLLVRHGEIVGGRELMHLLGYRSVRSFARACALQTLPIHSFELEGRRGRFARTRDVIDWLCALGQSPG
jgi:hypothetical protein